MNIYDVSKKAGVSIATTSRVINGSPKVSEKTRLKVMKVIEESGYTPNAFARGLGLDTMKTVGILCADSSDPYLAQAISFIEQGLKRHHYDSLLSCTGYELSNKKNSLNLLLSKRVDGIIMVGSNYIEGDDSLNDYIRSAAANVPLLIVNGVLDNADVYSTVCDDMNAVYQVTQKFINSGKRDILYVYNSTSYSGMKKLEGFKKCLENNNIPLSKAHTLQLPFNTQSISGIKDAIAEVYKKGYHFNGVVTSDDIIGIAALKFAKENMISVPDELFIAGFNNFSIALCCDPELTSVDNSLEALCTHCVSTLMGVFDGKEMPRSTVFAPKIRERGTTKFT